LPAVASCKCLAKANSIWASKSISRVRANTWGDGALGSGLGKETGGSGCGGCGAGTGASVFTTLVLEVVVGAAVAAIAVEVTAVGFGDGGGSCLTAGTGVNGAGGSCGFGIDTSRVGGDGPRAQLGLWTLSGGM
jgi:hypothetical protein